MTEYRPVPMRFWRERYPNTHDIRAAIVTFAHDTGFRWEGPKLKDMQYDIEKVLLQAYRELCKRPAPSEIGPIRVCGYSIIVLHECDPLMGKYCELWWVEEADFKAWLKEREEGKPVDVE
ncbi:MAG: hypothetical protein JRI80_00040 [Deltaproteobacteria bacterium]|nr:hypothetical protein [Deltaproteobacteria bacterium]